MLILGIDPGFERLGIALVEKEKGQKEKLIFSECFHTSKEKEFVDRLLLLGGKIEEILLQYKPTILSIETLYIETNQKTGMRVSEARGVILYLARKYGLEIYEYTPLQIKSAITGYGKADKKSVMLMIPKLIEISNSRKMLDDELDAIGIALTCTAHKKL